MTFIKCANCEKIISIKDLKIPFSPELLNGSTEENTVRGADLCAECAASLEEERKAAEEAARKALQPEAQEATAEESLDAETEEQV